VVRVRAAGKAADRVQARVAAGAPVQAVAVVVVRLAEPARAQALAEAGDQEDKSCEQDTLAGSRMAFRHER
jgi:hypothetical protein